MSQHRLEEIFKFAFQVEIQGKKFYANVSGFAQKKQAQDVFAYLSKAEEKHARIFQNFFNIYVKKKTSFTADDGFAELLDALARGLLFPDLTEMQYILNKDEKENITAIIKIAMDVEVNTILFYQRIKERIRQKPVQNAVNKIIKEEESHLVDLRNLRLDLDPLYAGLQYGRFF